MHTVARVQQLALLSELATDLSPFELPGLPTVRCDSARGALAPSARFNKRPGIQIMEHDLAEQADADRNYSGVDPELPSVDRFIRGTVNSLNNHDDEVHAFVRAGLFRSFTARKVLLPQ